MAPPLAVSASATDASRFRPEEQGVADVRGG